MLYEIMKSLKNFFPVSYHYGTWTVSDGVLSIPYLKDGQYYLVEGSTFNDGVYRYGIDILDNETFEGHITALAPPKAFLNLVGEIEEWQEKHGESAQGPYTSESFDGYSYTKAMNSNGNAVGWQDVFQSRLNAWRKL